jgi:ABC-2 type transport system ATP-binding protein
MIEISNLSMRYGDLLALDGLDLVIPRGELFAFLGPNAAGKTTTIKLLTGLIEPTSGSARICGYDIQKEPLEAKRRIGYIPDVAEFYDKLTPVEFMAFIAELFQVPHEAAKTRTPELMERFSLVPYARQRIENLSHGTRQRLAFASAFLHEPEVVIVDEPMVGLDPKNARVVKEELKARSREGVTVFLSTHLLNVAQELADRVGIINHGKLLALGTVEEIRAQAGGRADESLEELFLDLTGGEEETPG